MRNVFVSQFVTACLILGFARASIGAESFGIPYFETDILPLIQSNCITCHGPKEPKGGLVLCTYDGILKGSEHGAVVKPGHPLQSRLVKVLCGLDSPSMPPEPFPKLTPDAVDVIVRWIAYGALSKDGSPLAEAAAPIESKPEGVAADLRFETDILPILEQNCTGCHGPTDPKAGLVLCTYEGAMKGSVNGVVIVPGKGMESKLLRRICGAEEPRMPPKPFPPVSQENVQLIQQWIDSGAKAGPATQTIAAVESQANTQSVSAKTVDYVHGVFPILERSCFGCHGPKEPKGGLMLCAFEAALKGSEHGPVIVPGKAQESKLFRLVCGADQPQMPPKPLPPLSADEIAVIQAWIDGGAVKDAGESQEPSAPEIAALPEPESKPQSKTEPITPIDPNAITFETSILPIFQETCAACHGPVDPKEDLTLTSYESVMKGGEHGPVIVPGKSMESKLFRLICGADEPHMPPKPVPPLSPEKIALVQQWIDGGALSETDISKEAAPEELAAVDESGPFFTTDILPILNERCVGCHGPTDPKAGLMLCAFDAVMKGNANGAVVIPGKNQESKLLRRICGLDQPQMPPKPFPTLEQKQIELIQTWIDNGAKDVPSPVKTTQAETPAKQQTSALKSIQVALTFERDVLPILQANCLGCHGPESPKGGLVLCTYDGIMKGGEDGVVVLPGKPNESRLLRVICGLDDLKMPPKPFPPLKSEDIHTIESWILAGALSTSEKVAASEAEPSHETAEATQLVFETDIQPILDKNCIGCHGTVNPEAMLRLTSMETILRGSKNGPVIIPGKSSDSKLVALICGKDGRRMPPEPHPPLKSEQIETIQAWIDSGAESKTSLGLETSTASSTSPSGDRSAAASPKPESPKLAQSQGPFFDRDIHPILQTKCGPCHGETNPQAGLTLTKFDAVLKGSKNGKVVVPHKGLESRLLRVVCGLDEPKMPPKDFPPLTQVEIDKLQAWINGGAPASADQSTHDEGEKSAAAAGQADLSRLQYAEGKVDSADGQIGALAFHPTMARLAVGRIGTITLYDIDTESATLQSAATLAGHTQLVRALDFNSEGTILAAAGGEPGIRGEIALWNLQQKSPALLIEGHTDCIFGVDISPDNHTIASCSYDRLGKLWDLNTGAELHNLKDHVDAVYAIHFSPDGTRVATVGGDRTVKIWDVSSGKRLFTLSEPLKALNTLAFHPSGNQLAAAGADKMIRIWDLQDDSGRMTVSTFAHDGPVLALMYAPDGNTLISTAEDRAIKFWNTDVFSERQVLEPQSDWVNAMALDSSGRWLAVGRFDGSLTLYETSTGAVHAAIHPSPRTADAPHAAPAPIPAKETPKKPTEPAEKPDHLKQAGKVRLVNAELPTRPAVAEASAPTNVKVVGDDPFLVSVVQGNGTYPSALSSITPRIVTRGSEVEFTIEGKNLDRAQPVLDTPEIKTEIIGHEVHPYPEFKRMKGTAAEIVDTGRPHTLNVKATLPSDLKEGFHQLYIQTPLATTNPISFYVQERAPMPETDAKATLLDDQTHDWPIIVHGKIEAIGEFDDYPFEVKTGDELTFASLTRELGLGANLRLEIRTEDGAELQSSDAFGLEGDARLAYRFETAGKYRLRVTDKEMQGGREYRFAVGKRPLITQIFPLGVQRGKTNRIFLEGYNLGGKSTIEVEIPADFEGRDFPLPFETKFGTPITPIQLAIGDDPSVLERENNNTAKTAMPVNPPIAIDGVIDSYGDAQPDRDFYRFSARKGEIIIVDIRAQSYGSALDSIIEVLYADGTSIPIATVRSVAQTFVTLSERDARSGGIRLDSWADLRLNDYVMVGSEILRVVQLPDYPDEDVIFANNKRLGWRYGLFGTTPGFHAVNAPAYKVEIHDPGKTFPPNGMPVRTLYAENDDGPAPFHNRDSYFRFTAPDDGDYLVSVRDALKRGGQAYTYRLAIRPPRPDFNLYDDTDRINMPQEGGVPLGLTVDRLDGFDEPIEISVEGLPEGYTASSTTVLPGEEQASLVLRALPGAQSTPFDATFSIVGRAQINGSEVTRKTSFGSISIVQAPDVLIVQEPREVTLVPGQQVPVTVKVERRNGFNGRIPIEVRNLPYGIYVMDTGLNGILVTEDQNERTYMVYCEPWVKPMERGFYSIAIVETRSPLPNRNVSNLSTLRVQSTGLASK